MHRRAGTWFVGILTVACGSGPSGLPAPDAGPTDGGVVRDASTPDAGPMFASLEVNWAPCTLATNAGEPAECADVAVPYRWDVSQTATITVSVKRYLKSSERRAGSRSPNRSGRRVSPRWSRSGARAYSVSRVTNTARDLGELIRATRSSDDEVFVYALSYGTYLANRYLQLYPDQSSGVVLDSICGPEECRSSKADERFDAVVHRYFDTCAQDAFCNARLGDDPWSRFGAVRDALEAGHCPEATNAGLNRDADSSRTAGG